MNGAEALVKTMLAKGVDTCFANPGTSEMHFVAALDSHPDMRCVLCLFEGGTSGAADGYYRMSGNVAATLLHLAPGFGNAFANLHNARKAGSGIVNIVGDHASYHLRYESPLKGDVAGVSNAVSHWTRVSANALSVATDGAAAINAARALGGQIATLILPANTAWEEGRTEPAEATLQPLQRPDMAAVRAAAEVLHQPGACLIIGGPGLYGEGRMTAGRIARKTGCRLLEDTSVVRSARGGGTVAITPLPYPVDAKMATLAEARHIVNCGANRPVAFFAYPGKPSLPEPAGCLSSMLCEQDMDIAWTLDALAGVLGISATDPADLIPLAIPDLPTGPLTLEGVGQTIAALMPENSIIVNESITAGAEILPPLTSARAHDLLGTTGGAIGQCLPCAVGAAVACPERQVIALTGDGSAMYTLQSLWTMAREELDVVTVVINNGGYQILHGELVNVGVNDAGRNARQMFDITEPGLDWVALAKGHGVPGARATDAGEFNAAFRAGLACKGPFLIEVMVG